MRADNIYFSIGSSVPPLEKGSPLAQLVECRTLDRKVAGSNLTRGAVLCN